MPSRLQASQSSHSSHDPSRLLFSSAVAQSLGSDLRPTLSQPYQDADDATWQTHFNIF
jgi:hypothetical protein